MKNLVNVINIGDTVSDIEEKKCAGVRSFGILECLLVIGLSETEWIALVEEEKRTKAERDT